MENLKSKKFLNEVNGIACGMPELPPWKKYLVEQVFEDAKKEFLTLMRNTPETEEIVNHSEEVLIGSRCTVSGVCARLIRVAEKVDKDSVKEYVLDALRDCSSADYYYFYVKDYGVMDHKE